MKPFKLPKPPAAPIKYHRQVFLPKPLNDEALSVLVRKNGEYSLSGHARQRMFEKGVTLPQRIPFQRVDVIEVTVENDKLSKFLVRFDSCDGVNDIVLSYTVDGTVLTVYHNRKDDKHFTLDRSQYRRRAA